jgi:hypothetical protein
LEFVGEELLQSEHDARKLNAIFLPDYCGCVMSELMRMPRWDNALLPVNRWILAMRQSISAITCSRDRPSIARDVVLLSGLMNRSPSAIGADVVPTAGAGLPRRMHRRSPLCLCLRRREEGRINRSST